MRGGSLGLLFLQVVLVASLTRSDKCGGNRTIDEPGFVTSPGYPIAHPPSQNCLWVITATEPRKKIQINFNPVFDLEDRDCKKDYVEVYNGGDELSPSLGRFCGNTPPPQIVSGGSQLLIKFVSDNDTHRAGFSFRYEAVRTDECRLDLKADEAGYVTSPGYPMSYPASQNCVWVITAPEADQRVRLTFNQYFQLGDKDCLHDYMEVYNGGSTGSPPLGKFCGDVAPPPIISGGSQILVHFVTKNETQEAGFSFRYEAVRTDPSVVRGCPNSPRLDLWHIDLRAAGRKNSKTRRFQLEDWQFPAGPDGTLPPLSYILYLLLALGST